MSIRIPKLGELRDWWRSFKEPKHVDKASKSDRRKRTLWEIGSVFLSFALAALPIFAAQQLGVPINEGGYTSILLAIYAIILAGVIDVFIIFPWGVERFGIIVPWQFRDAEVAENGE